MGNEIQKPSGNVRQSVLLSDALHVNKDTLLFGDVVLEVNKKYKDEIIITNLQNFKINFKLEQIFEKDFQLKFTPEKGSLASKSKKKIKASLILRQKINKNFRVNLSAETQGQIFLNVRLRSESGVFGVDPESLEWFKHPTRDLILPQIIITLDIAFREKGGFTSEGVFRLAGEQGMVKSLKERLNKSNGIITEDMMDATVDDISNLIKLWFRELPRPILNVLSCDQIFYSTEPAESYKAFESLNEKSRALLTWLFDLMIEVAKNRETNKMTIQNLAIVIAPNLYEPESTDPMEGLVMSQKAVQFVQNILNYLEALKEQNGSTTH
ncbi:RhoGAP domain containing protein [Entamoeba histolytica HM-1:IMSS-B]|uniref:RhoGAP domain containing protein n=6 Tax=Entamoeba histolytica TaxID=5759 RepID=C4LWG0_ENTH1|nr:RhoGAP domain containing protein [Entamoeba histolytica HM-1:IMSS]EMD47643.1 RhoGAP domain containing protein [Entamoeba histolytica KU27]EMH77789.1 RhoGAP domain containing protein [Entamoeba histolytica HM-1:IMSS-B]EMS11780.1 RhoGAP domain containing protein [Entamoeba histolytica HM-3:IMSS]ENY64806.1 RhoGAP domain containing protein [Entamoeba histolytica HM-1:IMSS-A]GAT93044.1 rhogap domain containing protein [Entamoeba histolytica]|eukprot:XP_656923.1 RhoGAP domain containing protein [Entamoeba histolytica HM-1:IMSS]